jgi:hypothetical protein
MISFYSIFICEQEFENKLLPRFHAEMNCLLKTDVVQICCLIASGHQGYVQAGCPVCSLIDRDLVHNHSIQQANSTNWQRKKSCMVVMLWADS